MSRARDNSRSGYRLKQLITVTASNAAQAEFTGLAENKRYLLIGKDIRPATDTANLNLRVGTSSAYVTGAAYAWAFIAYGTAGTTPAVINQSSGGFSNTEITIANYLSNVSAYAASLTLNLDVSATAGARTISDINMVASSAAAWYRESGMGGMVDSSFSGTFDRFKLYASSGNLYGVFTLYEVVE